MNIQWVQKYSVYLVVLFMVLGFLIGNYYNTGFLKSIIWLGLIIMVVPVMMNVKVSEIFHATKDLRVLMFAMVFNFLFIPLLAWFMGTFWFAGYPEFGIALILISLIPTGGMTASWVAIAKGNTHSAIVVVVFSLLLSVISVPIGMSLLGNTMVAVNPGKIFYHLVIIVFAPLFFGIGLRKLIVKTKGIKYYKDISKNFSSISMLGVFFVVFVSVSLKAKTILMKPELLWTLVPGLFIFYGINYGISTVFGTWFFERNKGVAFIYGTVMKNLTIAMAVAVVSFDPLTSLLIAVAYTVQVPTAVFYLHHLDRIFPKEKPPSVLGIVTGFLQNKNKNQKKDF